MTDLNSEPPGLVHLPQEDVLAAKLFVGETLEPKTTGHPVGGGELRLPRIDFMVSATGTIELISIVEASKTIPAAVAKNASDLALRPGRVSDLPDAVALPLFPEAMVVGRTLQPLQLPSGHRVDVLCAKSGRIIRIYRA
jgi:hypothetical protein